MGTLNFGVSLAAFDKSRLMLAPDVTLTLTLLTFITHKLHQHTANIHSFLISSHTYRYIALLCAEVVKEYKVGHTLASVRSKEWRTRLKCANGQIYKTHSHTHVFSLHSNGGFYFNITFDFLRSFSVEICIIVPGL